MQSTSRAARSRALRCAAVGLLNPQPLLTSCSSVFPPLEAGFHTAWHTCQGLRSAGLPTTDSSDGHIPLAAQPREASVPCQASCGRLGCLC